MSSTIVYVGCATGNEIAVLGMNRETGALSLIDRVPVPGLNEPSPGSLPLALSPDRRFLYAALRKPPYPLCSYAIDPRNGALTLIGSTTLPDTMAYLSVDGSGRWLFSASYFGAKLAVNPIGANGVAGPAVQVVATPPNAHSDLADPENRFVYAACLGGDAVLCQAFDPATGRLNPTAHSAATTRAAAGPRHFVFGRKGARLYLINEIDATINTYARDPLTGALQELQTVSMLAEGVSGRMAAADIHLTPDESFLYGSERVTHTLVGFRVDPGDGTLTLVDRIPSEPTPRGFAIEPRGRFLLCAGMTAGTVGWFAINPESGALTRMGGVEVGGEPNWVEVLDFPL